MIFTPLARDATIAALRPVLEEIRARVADDEERSDLYVALLVMAEVDPWKYNLYKEIVAMMNTTDPDLLQKSRVLREAYENGEQHGIEKLLRAIFMQRLGRALTEREQQALATRAHAVDPAQLASRTLSLDGEALVGWLLDPNAK